VSFDSYIENIKAKTGKTPPDFRALAEKAGVLKADMKAAELVEWLKQEFDLGHGHSMAIWNVFVTNSWVETRHTRISKRPSAG
jgi:hypothetical protein